MQVIRDQGTSNAHDGHVAPFSLFPDGNYYLRVKSDSIFYTGIQSSFPKFHEYSLVFGRR